MPAKKIDRESPIPAYYQIEIDIKERISKGEWSRDRQLPSEAKLCEEYEISRITLRQALAELEKDGIIQKVRGKGAFINDNSIPFVHSLNYALASADRLGQKPYDISATVLDIRLIPDPYQEVRDSLRLEPDAPVVYFKRLFYYQSKPIALGRSWLPAALVPGLAEEGLIDNELSTTLRERYGIAAERVDDYLEVIRATPSDSDQLEIAHDCPLLLVKGVSFLPDTRPLEYSNTLWPGDRVRLQISLKNISNQFSVVL